MIGRQSETTVLGIKIRFYSSGNGSPPILYLPGILGGSKQPTIESLEPDYDVFAPDYPGFGSDEAPHLDLPFLADLLLEFCKREIGDRQILGFGQSAGGTGLVHLAVKRPGIFDKLVLFEPIVIGHTMPWWLRWMIRTSAYYRQAPEHIISLGPKFAFMFNRLHGGRNPSRLVGNITSPQNAGQFGRSLLRSNIVCDIQILAVQQVPILILRGSGRGLVPPKSLDLVGNIHISHERVLGVDHILGGTAQKEVAEAAMRFFKSSEAL